MAESVESPSLSTINYKGVCYVGWPIFYSESMPPSDAHSKLRESTKYPIPRVLNVVVGLLIVASTFFVFVFPLWRQRKLFQVKLESLFIFTATVAILCALYRMADPIYPPALIFDISQHDPATRFFYMFPLYLQIPLGLGIGCTIYWCIWLAVRLVSALVRILVKRRAVVQSE